MRRSFARQFGSLESIFGMADEFFEIEQIRKPDRLAVCFGIEEIFTNMVKYNRENGKEIQIELNRDGDRVLVTLTDFDVEPFDVTKSAKVLTNQPLQERTPGGLGLHLTKKMMERVDYDYTDRCSTIILTRKLE